jgi:hypothetical protein
MPAHAQLRRVKSGGVAPPGTSAPAFAAATPGAPRPRGGERVGRHPEDGG